MRKFNPALFARRADTEGFALIQRCGALRWEARGACARFKDILERSGILAQWYEFEATAQEKALRKWCEVNSI